MPFVVQCPYCDVRSRVPERALGASGKCPSCGSFFTLSPEEDQRAPVSAAPTVASTPGGGGAVATALVEAAPRLDVVAEAVASAEPEAVEARPRLRFQPAAAAGAAALFIGGAALLCASFPRLCVLVLPLGGAGMLVGVVAIVLARKSTKAALILSAVGALAPGMLSLTALAAPALLGPTYQLSRQRGLPTPAGAIAIPLADAPRLTETPEWTDASRYSLQRGNVRMQVVSVALEALRGHENSDAAKEKTLQVRLRIALTPSKIDMNERPFDWDANRRARPMDGTKIPSPTLADAAGGTYAFRENAVVEALGGKRRAHLFPASTADEVLTFAPPPEGWESLRFEVPAEAWAGTGPFRFSIPKKLLEEKTSMPVVKRQ